MAALGKVLSEREAGSSGNSSDLVGLSWEVMREWGDGQEPDLQGIFIYHFKKLGLYSESDKEPLTGFVFQWDHSGSGVEHIVEECNELGQ